MSTLDKTLTDIVDACETALNDAGRPVESASTVPGAEVAWDTRCGQLWALAATVTPQYGRGDCGIEMIRATVQVGVLRCVGMIDDRGLPPTPERMGDDETVIIADMTVIARTLECASFDRVQASQLQGWTPVGPDGGVAGGYWTVQLAYLSAGFLRGT